MMTAVTEVVATARVAVVGVVAGVVVGVAVGAPAAKLSVEAAAVPSVAAVAGLATRWLWPAGCRSARLKPDVLSTR